MQLVPRRPRRRRLVNHDHVYDNCAVVYDRAAVVYNCAVVYDRAAVVYDRAAEHNHDHYNNHNSRPRKPGADG